MENQQKDSTQSIGGANVNILHHKKNPSGTLLANRQSESVFNRSKLSTASFIKWLRSRFFSKLPKRFPYLYFPHELTRETSIQQIFVEFDSDGSGGLSRDQILEMFNGFGINITMQHLNELYDSVEVNLEELDCQMFKKCALSQKSNKVFREIVRELEFDLTSYSEDQKQYLPHNFTNMIIYLVYLSKRQQLRMQVQQQKTGIQSKVQSIQHLLKLKDLSLNNERLLMYTENMKKNLNNKFRDIWQKVNQKYGQIFPLTPKMEEQFYKFYLKKQSLSNTTATIVTNRNISDKQIHKKKKF